METVIEALKPYGAMLNNLGQIVRDGKTLAIVVKIKNNRIRFESASGGLLFSGPITAKSVENFVESYWFWKKRR